MRSLNYMFICMSCVLNWFAYAYKPLGSLFSKKVLKKNSMIRAISGLIQSVSITSLRTFNQRDFSLNMVASTFGGGSNKGQVNFDTNSFLNWWFGNKKNTDVPPLDIKVPSTGAQIHQINLRETTLSAVPTASVGIERTYENTKIHKSSATNVARSTLDSPTFLAGYMDFDPMVAATRSHSTSAHHRGRRTSWFNRSD